MNSNLHNNDLQNNTHTSKDRVTRTHKKIPIDLFRVPNYTYMIILIRVGPP